jgi:DOPA 4,5-dioxygenase
MSDAPDAIKNRGYHAHIYYDPQRTRPAAERLCAVLGQQCQVQFGGFRDEPVGPHPVANVQVIFAPEQFQPVVEWLMLHRDGLDVLIHPLTDNSVDDHSSYAMWLGSPVPLKLDTLRRNYRPELLPSA